MKKTKPRGQTPGTFHLDKRADQIISSGQVTDDPDMCWSTQELAAKLGVSVQWLEIQRGKGGGPPFEQLADRLIRYRASKVRAWLEKRSYNSTAEYKKTRRGRAAS